MYKYVGTDKTVTRPSYVESSSPGQALIWKAVSNKTKPVLQNELKLANLL